MVNHAAGIDRSSVRRVKSGEHPAYLPLFPPSAANSNLELLAVTVLEPELGNPPHAVQLSSTRQHKQRTNNNQTGMGREEGEEGTAGEEEGAGRGGK